MRSIKKYKEELFKVLDQIPENKIIELFDFAQFLMSQSAQSSKSSVDKEFLLLQQKSLSKVWDNPEEDVYEL